MALEQLFQEQIEETTFDERDIPMEKLKTIDDDKLEDNLSGGFECNICLDVVHDPIVTLCGHLYCWPCIYKWIHFKTVSSENIDNQQPKCPVCKAEVSQKTLIPLYGHGQATKTCEIKAPNFGIVIPQRPPSPRCRSQGLIGTTDSIPPQQLHHRNHSQQSPTYQPYMTEPMLSPGGMSTGEIVYARMFGNSSTTNLYTYPSSYNLAGRQLSHADRSLSRVCFFLCCCLVTCLLLF